MRWSALECGCAETMAACMRQRGLEEQGILAAPLPPIQIFTQTLKRSRARPSNSCPSQSRSEAAAEGPCRNQSLWIA